MRKWIPVLLTLGLFAGCARLRFSPIPTAAPTLQVRATFSGFSADEIDTLNSIHQVDDHPLLSMYYVGDYNGRSAAFDLQLPDDSASAWACSLFAALADPRAMLYGRNFDWRFSPAVLLFTAAPDAYASVSMVDIEYLGFTEEDARSLVDAPLQAREALLDAPFLPFDGMNEKGLVVGMAAVPPGNMSPDPGKSSIDSLTVIREMLDRAATVEQAVAIMQNYNIDMGSGPALHYLIADASGSAVLVEYFQGEMVVIPNQAPWHAATNFLEASGSSDPEGTNGRYNRLVARLTESGGSLSSTKAMELLADVSQDITQWSVVYQPRTGTIHVVLDRHFGQVYTFQLEE
jgi:hypothetical protein